jgi:lysyl oxidase-like protein 2/3/4
LPTCCRPKGTPTSVVAAWGLVCGDGWSIFEAMVVCRQLGLGYANDAIQTDFFGGNASSMVLSGVQCRGDEEFLSHCLHDQIGQISCPGKRENIAAVVCTSGKQYWK